MLNQVGRVPDYCGMVAANTQALEILRAKNVRPAESLITSQSLPRWKTETAKVANSKFPGFFHPPLANSSLGTSG